jgi:hypothetical protein
MANISAFKKKTRLGSVSYFLTEAKAVPPLIFTFCIRQQSL